MGGSLLRNHDNLTKECDVENKDDGFQSLRDAGIEVVDGTNPHAEAISALRKLENAVLSQNRPALKQKHNDVENESV